MVLLKKGNPCFDFWTALQHASDGKIPIDEAAEPYREETEFEKMFAALAREMVWGGSAGRPSRKGCIVDAYLFYRSFINGDRNGDRPDEYWDAVIEQAGKLYEKHKSPFGKQMTLSCLELIDMEGRKENAAKMAA